MADELPFVALHLNGAGGVGKTTLLEEFARVANEAARSIVRIDGRNMEPSPAGSVARSVMRSEPSASMYRPFSTSGRPAVRSSTPMNCWRRSMIGCVRHSSLNSRHGASSSSPVATSPGQRGERTSTGRRSPVSIH